MLFEQRPRILLVGAAGQQGKEYYALLKNEFQISAVVDPNIEALDAFYKEESVALYRDLETALKEEDFQVAIVCVPHGFHYSLTMSLLKNKKIVIKEKPLALSIAEVQAYKAIPDAKIFTIVQRQFNPVFVNAKKDLPLLGRIYSYRYDYFLKIQKKSSDWRASFDNAGGGILTDMGYHAVDMILSFFGKPSFFTGNFSYCYEDTAQAKLEDSVSILLSHAHGQIQGNLYFNKHHSSKKEEFEIIGAEGTLLITPNWYKIFDRKGDLVKEFVPQTQPSDAKAIMFREYMNSIKDNAFIDSHTNHHEDVVSLIENVYKLVGTKN